jgi:hypothetical protein
MGKAIPGLELGRALADAHDDADAFKSDHHRFIRHRPRIRNTPRW